MTLGDPEGSLQGQNGMTVAEVSGLVNLFAGMLNTSTSVILARLDDNSKAAAERWAKHDAELDRNREAIVLRFAKLEERLDKDVRALDAHLSAAHDEKIAIDARVRPVKTLAEQLARNWRTILLFIVAMLAILGFSGETIQRILGS